MLAMPGSWAMASSRKPAPADLSARVGAFLAPRLHPGARLCLGYSGGIDSTALLHILVGLRAELGFRLHCLHVNHGLSPHADRWAESCAQFCARLGVPLEQRAVRVVADGLGLEASARVARYEAFDQVDTDFVVLAHHADDQAETLLLRLVRGAGAQGLSAMARERPLVRASLLRPLLDTSRAELEAYVRRNGLSHVEDESNEDTGLTRNWLRHDILPALETRFPSVGSVLARTADLLSEGAGLLDELARIDMETVADGSSLNVAELKALSTQRGRNLVRYWLRQETGSVPSAAQLDVLLDQIWEAGRDRQLGWRWAGWIARRHRNRLTLVVEGAPPGGVLTWRGEAELDLAEHGRLVFSQSVGEGLLVSEGKVAVAWRTGGEKLKPDCRRPRRTLKNLLREAGLSPDERQRLPLLFIDGQLAWVPGIGTDCAFQAGVGEPGWLISWLPQDRSTP